MNIPCPTPCNPCSDPSSPFIGFSSETPDSRTFVCADYGSGQLVPPLDSCWQQRNFVSFTSSTVSETIACELADTLVQEAAAVAWCQTQFSNSPQSCSVLCPDGSTFFYTVPGGVFVANNQDAANALAMQFACEQAPSNLICIALPTFTESCLNTPFTSEIVCTSPNLPLTIGIAGGVLPPGLSLTQDSPQSAMITGTPTVGGSFTFAVQASDVSGNVAHRQFTIQILTLANSPILPQAFIGVPYSVQLAITGTTVNAPVWAVSGSLPQGLNLNIITGVISGTPTTGGASNFTISFSDGEVNCATPVSINVKLGDFTTGIAAWWKFNEGSGTVINDSSGNGNSSSGTVTWVPGQNAGLSAVRTVGGVPGAVMRRGILNPLTGLPSGFAALSICCWYRKTLLVQTETFVALFGYGTNTNPGNRLQLCLDSNGSNIGVEDVNGALEYAAPNDTAWHHLACVWPGGNVSLSNAQIYVDGILKTGPPTLFVDVTPTFIAPGSQNEIWQGGLTGHVPDSGTNTPDADMNDCRIYPFALTQAEITAIFNNPA